MDILITKNKKGELTDMFIFLITMFILAIGLLIMIFVIPNITTGLKSAGLNNSAEGVNAINGLERIGTHTINNGFLLIFVGLTLSMLITSFLVRTHPIFLLLYIFMLVITVILGAYLGNVYYDLQNSATFSSVIDDASYINTIMNHIVEITIGVAILSMIIVFAKFSTFGGTQQF